MVTSQGEIIQAFELMDGKVNITGGMIDVRTLIHCVEDAVITIHFAKGDVSIDMMAGQDYAVNDTSVTVVSGKVHFN